MSATCHTRGVFRFREKLSPRQKLWLGFAWCPFLTWFGSAAQILLALGINSAFPGFFRSPLPLAVVFMLASWFACCSCAALFCGFGAAFFWNELTPGPGQEAATAFWSIVLAWSPTFLLGCSWVILLLPFVFFVALYHAGLSRGHTFWNSRSPHQWIGDFSEPE